MYTEDTIVAISTPLGEGGIGIVRLSGNGAIKIAEKIFKSPSGRKIKELSSREMIHGFSRHPRTGEPIDEVLVSVMKAPGTYTREDVVEINCHGGIVPLRGTLEAALEAGARMAEPGEFTKRAFLNGRIDLSQCEATLDIIKSKTDASLRAAMGQLEGRLSSEINLLRSELTDILAHLEATVDFSDEDIDPLPRPEIIKRLRWAREKNRALIDSAKGGRLLREGVNTVIVGKPNVGKSSLLNALLSEERAIVTPIPGTTRDVIEEGLNVKGVPLVLKDTAGIRHPKDVVESAGVELSRQSLRAADLVLCVLDGSGCLDEEDMTILREARGKKTIVVINKSDLPRKIDETKALEVLGGGDANAIPVSALYMSGLDLLRDAIFDAVVVGRIVPGEEVMVTNVRHLNALRRTRKHLSRSIKALRKDLSEEFVASDVRDALSALGEIVGETITEDVLDKIFSQFCIGK